MIIPKSRRVRASILVYASLVILFAIPAPASAQSMELEANLTGSAAAWPAVTPGIRVGVVLLDDLVLSTGFDAHVSSASADGAVGGIGFGNDDGWGITVPIEAKFYVTDPDSGSLVPIVRVGAAYGQNQIQGCCRWQRVSLSILMGAQYLVDEHLGFAIEGGPEVSHQTASDMGGFGHMASTHLRMMWRSSLILRM